MVCKILVPPAQIATNRPAMENSSVGARDMHSPHIVATMQFLVQVQCRQFTIHGGTLTCSDIVPCRLAIQTPGRTMELVQHPALLCRAGLSALFIQIRHSQPYNYYCTEISNRCLAFYQYLQPGRSQVRPHPWKARLSLDFRAYSFHSHSNH